MLEALWEMIFIFIPLLFRVVCVCGMLSASHREMKARAEKNSVNISTKASPWKIHFYRKNHKLISIILIDAFDTSWIVGFYRCFCVCIYISNGGSFSINENAWKSDEKETWEWGWRGGSSWRRGQNEKSIENDEKVLNVNFLELRDGKLNSRWLDTIN